MLSKQIMKNFDLDKIDKKMPYKTPDEGFFEKVQESVLEKTVFVYQKETKIFPFFSSKMISVAAAVIILFGMIFFWNRFSISENNEINFTTKTLTNKNNNSNLDLTNRDSYTLTQEEQGVFQNKQKNPPQQKSNFHSAHHDNFLISLSDEELESIIENSDQDVYLELYTHN